MSCVIVLYLHLHKIIRLINHIVSALMLAHPIQECIQLARRKCSFKCARARFSFSSMYVRAHSPQIFHLIVCMLNCLWLGNYKRLKTSLQHGNRMSRLQRSNVSMVCALPCRSLNNQNISTYTNTYTRVCIFFMMPLFNVHCSLVHSMDGVKLVPQLIPHKKYHKMILWWNHFCTRSTTNTNRNTAET